MLLKKEDVQCARFSDLKGRVLEPAREEIAETSDIRFEYELEKGSHGKVYGIIFIISLNNPVETTKEAVRRRATTIRDFKHDDDIVDIEEEAPEAERVESQKFLSQYTEMKEYIRKAGVSNTKGFSTEYFDSLLSLANGNIDVIKKAVDLGKESSHIRNYYGWLRTAVEKRFADAETVDVVEGSDTPPVAVDVNAETKRRIWERAKKHERFGEFLKRCDSTTQELEIVYSVDELIKMFYDFKAGRF